MWLTVKGELPELLIVNVAVAVVPVVTAPKARLPLNPMIRVAAAVPVPEAAMVLVPPVASLWTVMIQLYVIRIVGVNDTGIPSEPPAGITPLKAPLKPAG